MKNQFLKFLSFAILLVFVFNSQAQIKTTDGFRPVNSNNTSSVINSVNNQLLNPGQDHLKRDVTIGTGTLMEYYPIYPFYGYSYSQSIYLKTEIGYTGNITKISYYFNGATLANSNKWTIYMGHTTKNSFSGLSDWIPISGLTQVYTGTFTSPTGPGWIEFTLTTPFYYNNTDNLVIAVDENASGFNSSSDKFYSSNVSANRSLIFYDDDQNPNPTSPPTAMYRETLIPNLKMKIFSANANDVSITSVITPEMAMLPGTITPQVTVKNCGGLGQSNIPISFKVNNGAVSTVYIPYLASQASTNVSFADWTGTLGTYDFVFYSDLATDDERDNDTIKRSLSVLSRLTRAFCFKDNSQPSSFIIENPVAGLVNMGNAVPWVCRAGTYYSPSPSTYKWFVIGSDNNLYSIDTLTGNATFVGATGVSDIFLSGLTYDKSTGTLYASALDGAPPAFTFHLYSVNKNNGVASLVATSPIQGLFIDIACNNYGQLYAIESRADTAAGRLYTLNKTTGELTLVGTNLGGEISSNSQDIEFSDNNILYLTTAKGMNGILDGLYTINTTTGEATLISNFKNPNIPIVGLGIQTQFGASVKETENGQFRIFPNPIKDYISIIANNNEMIKTIKVYSLTGKLVYFKKVDYIATTINTSQLKSGFYLIQVETNSGLFTQKIVVAE